MTREITKLDDERLEVSDSYTRKIFKRDLLEQKEACEKQLIEVNSLLKEFEK